MKVLFITHESSRTGAPLMLLYFMQWLKSNRTDIVFDVLTLRPGEIDAAYREVANRHFEIEKKTKGGLKKQLFDKIEEKLLQKKSKNETTFRKIKNEKYSVIYANSIAALPTAIYLNNGTSKLIAHIHEMEVNLAKYAPDFNKLIPNVSHFIAASKAVKNDLSAYDLISTDRISVIYEMSKVNAKQNDLVKKDHFTVGGAGLVGWRKGTDIFIQVANYINTYFNEYDIQFEWLGKISKSQILEIKSDLRKMNLIDKVHFVGIQNSPENYYRNFDVFLLTSREDPFPLVCIETGMLGKPILCFENATGSSEMLSEQDGVVIPYLDIRKMAEQIVYLHNNPKEKERIGSKNNKIFSHFTPEIICPKLIDTIDKLV